MASWPAQPYAHDPGRRASRSRSPRRRDSAAYPDLAPHDYPPGNTNFSGHDADHRKAWDEYYERRGRGRSRSPGGDEGRKRRRSPSPYDRDRFDPRPRYGDDYDTHSRSYGYASPRGRSTSYNQSYPQHPPPGVTRSGRVPVDPFTFQPHPATLRQYAEWFRANYPKEAKDEDDADRASEKEAGKKTRDGIRARWEKYKKQHGAIQLQTLFDHHKKSPWFSEKYNPSLEWTNLRARVRKEGWKGRPEQFLKDLDEGKHDPKPEPESPVKDDNHATGDDKPAVKLEDAEIDEDGPEHAADSNVKSETNGKTANQNGRGLREDDVLVSPEGNQIAIRTIPPDIGRQKIEEACRSVPGFVHLALGDPLQKRHYYRAGWMKFKEDSDIDTVVTQIGEKKIEGFKLHVNHVAHPYFARQRQTPEVANTPHRIEKDLQQIRQLALVLEDEYIALRELKDGAPEPKPEETKSTVKQEEEGDTIMAENGAAAANGVDPAITEESEVPVEPFERGSEVVERRLEKLYAEMQAQQDIAESDGVDTVFEVKKSLLALDMYLAYLRAAFNTCYYCVVVCDHVEELNRKCPRHLRKPLVEKPVVPTEDNTDVKEEEEKPKEQSKEKEFRDKNDRRWEKSDERWTEWIDSKIVLLINRSGVDPLEYGGKSFEDELRKAVEPHIKQEDEGKYRCRTCNKLFKASSFVEKHVANKHPELTKHLEELPFFNNFALDPHHIQPYAHLPQPVNNNNAPPPQAYGFQSNLLNYNPIDYNRPGPGFYSGYPPPAPYPVYGNGPANPYDYPHSGAWGGAPRRDDTAPRRLQERVGGYATTSSLTLTGVEGLPAKPATSMEPTQPYRRGRAATGPPPPPPPDAKEDPRAATGKKVSYHDMDDVAEGDVELTY
ncbi:hypothetical protein BU17DRAFT_80457 [Hysterangium stoloniferum]|nr:hypothetical protein BU17DRAFT_80457 [Hysterangium stoloniferum]